MKISGVENGNNVWKKVGKGVGFAGKMAAGGIAGAFIGGIGCPAVWTKEVVKSIGRDVLNLVTNKDVKKSLKKVIADTVGLPIGIAGFAVLGIIAGAVGGAETSAGIGSIRLKGGFYEAVDACVEGVQDLNDVLK